MKKKMKIFFKTGFILSIVFAFITQGIATITKPILSKKEILVNPDAEFGWTPVDASGLHTINGHKIILHETEQLVTLEIHVSGWHPSLLTGLQVTVDSAGYSNGLGGTLNPLGWPGSPEEGCFINTSKSDYVFYGMAQIDVVNTWDLNYIWGAVLLGGTKADDGQTYYLGTLILEVPVDASGEYTIEFLSDVDKTFMLDDLSQYILPIILTPAFITINEHPNQPAKPSGPTDGKVGTSYTYSSTTTDPNGDHLYYWFDWGDTTNSGWVGPYPSGAPGNASHTWTSKGSYNTQVKAKDVYDVESDWSDPLTITITKNKNKESNTIFLNFLDSHPNLFNILQKIIQRSGI